MKGAPPQYGKGVAMFPEQQRALLTAKQMEHEKLRRLQQNSYSVRVAEGRPVHGQASWMCSGTGIVVTIMQFMVLVMPYWRANWIYSIGYPMTRSWGLFAVSGAKTHLHHTFATETCTNFAQFNLGGACLSPICDWYMVKCVTYVDMTFLTYMIGFFQIIVLIVHTLCTVWIMRLKPKLIKWAASGWALISILQPTLVVLYYVITEELFGRLDSVSLYPIPQPAACFWASLLITIMLVTCATLSFSLKNIWPEPEESDSSDSDDEFIAAEMQQQVRQQQMMMQKAGGKGPPVVQAQQVQGPGGGDGGGMHGWQHGAAWASPGGDPGGAGGLGMGKAAW